MRARRDSLTVETPLSGLGPVFTEASCVACHANQAPGGGGARLVTHFGRVTGGQFDPMIAFGGPQLQDKGIGKFNKVNFVGEVVPPQATIVARRKTIPLFGLGLVDALPEQFFVQMANQEAIHNPMTAGRISEVVDPVTGVVTAGRFGWKAQQPSLFAFAGDAYVNELGVTTPLMPAENCPQGNCNLLSANPAATNPNELDNDDLQGFTDFITFLAPLPRGPVGPNEIAGAQVFAQIGCTDCHTPTLQTGPSPIAALNMVPFAPYSDFLLHNMGSLGDGIVQADAGNQEMRTTPLWGLRFTSNFLLHDGRANSIDAAILAHDGQAKPAKTNYTNLKATPKSQLIAFLNSL